MEEKSKKTWNMEKSRLFVNEYLKYECLWNTESTKYRSKDVKREAYQILASKFGLSIENIQQKIRSIRTTFKQEQNKIETIPNYVPRLLWFSLMMKTFNEGKIK